jgi:hypothetical protein
MVFDDKNANPVRTMPVIDAVRESLDATASDVAFNDRVSAWVGHDRGDGTIDRVKEVAAEARQSSFVEVSSFD